jgi:uncharacterized protein (DUF433 family)
MVDSRYVGIGLYTLPEVARMLSVPSPKLRRWARGYRYGQGRFSDPLFEHEFPELTESGVLTFMDLIELSLVVGFLEAGMSMRRIRAAAKRAREQFQTRYPFATRKFHTDGRRIFAETDLPDRRGRAYEEYPSGQQVFDHITPPFFKKLDYEADMIRAYWPLGKDRPVVLNPARAFGQPIDPRSGVPTRVLYAMHQAGESAEAVADWFEIEPEAVRSAIEYEQELAQAA